MYVAYNNVTNFIMVKYQQVSYLKETLWSLYINADPYFDRCHYS